MNIYLKIVLIPQSSHNCILKGIKNGGENLLSFVIRLHQIKKLALQEREVDLQRILRALGHHRDLCCHLHNNQALIQWNIYGTDLVDVGFGHHPVDDVLELVVAEIEKHYSSFVAALLSPLMTIKRLALLSPLLKGFE